MGVIYLRTNKINGKQYVGQAKNFKRRQYGWYDTKQPYAGALINNARRKYGVENFETTILEEYSTTKEGNELEKYYIKKLNTKFPFGYNLNDGGGSNIRACCRGERQTHKGYLWKYTKNEE